MQSFSNLTRVTTPQPVGLTNHANSEKTDPPGRHRSLIEQERTRWTLGIWQAMHVDAGRTQPRRQLDSAVWSGCSKAPTDTRSMALTAAPATICRSRTAWATPRHDNPARTQDRCHLSHRSILGSASVCAFLHQQLLPLVFLFFLSNFGGNPAWALSGFRRCLGGVHACHDQCYGLPCPGVGS